MPRKTRSQIAVSTSCNGETAIPDPIKHDAQNRLNLLGDVLYSPKAAFASLGVGNTKGWTLIAAGHLEVVRFGRRCTRVRGSSIKRLIQHGIPG